MIARMCPALLLLLASCGEEPGPAAPAPPQGNGAKPEAPKLPGEEDLDGATEILVKDPTYAERRRRDEYVQDEKLPSGSIRGLCAVTPPKGVVQAPPEKLLDVALAEPEVGELDYYRNLKLKTRGGEGWLGDRVNRSGQFGVTGAVLTLRGIRKGKRPAMVRPSYLVKAGRITTSWGSNSWGPFSFAPPGERANIGTYDGYPCRIVFTQPSSRRRLGEGEVSSFDKDTIKPLGGGGQHFTARPKMAQSPPLVETGMVEITCARHPWQKGWLCVWDSPYAGVVSGHHDPEQAGKFTMDGIPAGRHVLEVWHPDYEPVARSVEVEIRENETTELKIEFHWPKASGDGR
jgi:hypothetical protein